MANKKDYYDLDKIGFLGSQKNRTAAQMKKEIADTIKYIKSKKSTNRIALSKKTEVKVLKSK